MGAEDRPRGGWGGEVVIVPEHWLLEHLDRGLDTNYYLFTDTSRVRRELEYEEKVPRSVSLQGTVNGCIRPPE